VKQPVRAALFLSAVCTVCRYNARPYTSFGGNFFRARCNNSLIWRYLRPSAEAAKLLIVPRLLAPLLNGVEAASQEPREA